MGVDNNIRSVLGRRQTHDISPRVFVPSVVLKEFLIVFVTAHPTKKDQVLPYGSNLFEQGQAERDCVVYARKLMNSIVDEAKTLNKIVCRAWCLFGTDCCSQVKFTWHCMDFCATPPKLISYMDQDQLKDSVFSCNVFRREHYTKKYDCVIELSFYQPASITSIWSDSTSKASVARLLTGVTDDHSLFKKKGQPWHLVKAVITHRETCSFLPYVAWTPGTLLTGTGYQFLHGSLPTLSHKQPFSHTSRNLNTIAKEVARHIRISLATTARYESDRRVHSYLLINFEPDPLLRLCGDIDLSQPPLESA